MKKQHIIFVGRRNTGKSSLINVLTGQHTAIVSDVAGTTTDPVKKSYEIPGYAPVVFIDTAGTDDAGELGMMRVEKTMQAIALADLAILVIAGNQFGSEEEQLCDTFRLLDLPFIILHNQSDLEPLTSALESKLKMTYNVPVLSFSTRNATDASPILDAIRAIPLHPQPLPLIGDLINPGDVVLLVAPVDSAAPTGRLILPQVQTIRDVLDHRAVSIVLQPEELTGFLNKSGIRPQLVITDSQVFKKVAEELPADIPLTGFSIILARQKGNFEHYIRGSRQIDHLKDNDRILVLESCSHHVSCEDIGRVKIPALLKKYTGKELQFDVVAGLDAIKRPVREYALVIQCGGCMVTEKQLRNRLIPFIQAGVPISNYGMTIAYTNGIFERALQVFDLKK